MMNPLGYLRALFTFLTMSIESRFPSLSARKAISSIVAVIAIVVIVVAGALIIFFIVISPGASSSSYTGVP